MKYELLALEALCKRFCADDNSSKSIIEDIDDEVKRIQMAWRNAACENLEKSLFVSYTRQHQLSLCSLCNLANKHANSSSAIFNHLEDLHIFLAESFYDFIDMSVTVSGYCLPKTKSRLRQKLLELGTFTQSMGVLKSLAKAIIDELNAWIDKKHIIVYSQLHFILIFHRMIDDFIEEKNEPEKITGALVNRLCYINYNSLAVYEAMKDVIKAHESFKNNLYDQLDFLRSHLLHFKYLPVRKNVYYKTENRILSRSLSDWLNRYIKIKEKESLYIASENLTDTNMESMTKIMTSLSIEELALMTRLSIEVGVIRIKKNGLSALARFMAVNVRTLSKGIFDEFKPDTFYKYYYTASTINIQSVHSIIKRMQRKLSDMEIQLQSGKTLPATSVNSSKRTP